MKKLFLIAFLFISVHSFGQFKNNNQRIFNVENYGAKHDATTDDIAAIQAAVNACAAAGGGTVYFPSGIYSLGNSLSTSVGGIDMNSQIYVPYDSLQANFVVINFVGEQGGSPGNALQALLSAKTWNKEGVFLYSKYTGTHSSSVKGTSIIGTGSHGTNDYNFNCFNVYNINFLAKFNPNGSGPEIGGVNAKWTLGFNGNNNTYGVDTTTANFVTPQRDISGFETPENSAGASYSLNNCSAYGVKYGYIFGEHVSGDQLSASLCYAAVGMKYGYHASSLKRINSYWCVNSIVWYPYGTLSTTNIVFDVQQLDIEFAVGNAGKYYNTAYGVLDTTNIFVASIKYASVTQSSGRDNSTWAMNGGSGVNASPVGTGNSAGGSTTQVQYNSGGNFAGSSNLVWDNTNSRLGIGAVPLLDMQIKKTSNAIIGFDVTNLASNASAQAVYETHNDLGTGAQWGLRSSTTSVYGSLAAGEPYFYSTKPWHFMSDASVDLDWSTGAGGPPPVRMKLKGANGQLQLNAYTSGAITGTVTNILCTDASGNLIQIAQDPPLTFSRSATSVSMAATTKHYTSTNAGGVTYTLELISGNSGVQHIIKNAGTTNVTMAVTGADHMYTTSQVTTLTIIPGATAYFFNDGVNWNVEGNQ